MRLRENGARNIHILLVIVYEGTDLEDRQLVPIDRMMTFLNFRRPGNHLVLAKVVWTVGDTSKERLEKVALEKASRRIYEHNILDHNRTEISSKLFGGSLLGCLPYGADLDISVPIDHFPKEPPQWLSTLVNAGFKYPPIDQCSFRRRALLAPIRLPFFGLWAVITTIIRSIIVMVLLLRGMRHINYGAVIHPWSEDIDDVSRNLRRNSSWFQYGSDGCRREDRWVFLYLLYPPLDLLIAFVLTVLCFHYHASLLALIWMLMKVVWKPILFLTIGVGAIRYLGELSGQAERKRRIRESSREFRDAKERARIAEYDNLYKLLACRPGIAPDVENLPSEHRTIRLRFLDLKAKVCRPYAAH